MASTQRTQQLAVLLNLMGEEAAQMALNSLDSVTSTELNRTLNEFKNDPPTPSEIDYVLDDFERFFNFAMQHIQDELGDVAKGTASKKRAESVEEESFDVEVEVPKSFSKPKLTGDVRQDLNLLHPYQVAYALRNDNPLAIAVVIKSLADAHAAKTLESLPREVCMQVFLKLTNPIPISERVKNQILTATLNSAMKVEARVPEEDRKGQLVALMRSLGKDVRVPLIEKLKEENPELADGVKAEIYQFDDLLKIDDRDIQKILAQSDSDAIVLSLVGAPDELRDKLLSNMSKRARQTIEDELEYKTNAKQEDIESGRRQIVETFVRMDEEGEISLA